MKVFAVLVLASLAAAFPLSSRKFFIYDRPLAQGFGEHLRVAPLMEELERVGAAALPVSNYFVASRSVYDKPVVVVLRPEGQEDLSAIYVDGGLRSLHDHPKLRFLLDWLHTGDEKVGIMLGAAKYLPLEHFNMPVSKIFMPQGYTLSKAAAVEADFGMVPWMLVVDKSDVKGLNFDNLKVISEFDIQDNDVRVVKDYPAENLSFGVRPEAYRLPSVIAIAAPPAETSFKRLSSPAFNPFLTRFVSSEVDTPFLYKDYSPFYGRTLSRKNVFQPYTSFPASGFINGYRSNIYQVPITGHIISGLNSRVASPFTGQGYIRIPDDFERSQFISPFSGRGAMLETSRSLANHIPARHSNLEVQEINKANTGYIRSPGSSKTELHEMQRSGLMGNIKSNVEEKSVFEKVSRTPGSSSFVEKVTTSEILDGGALRSPGLSKSELQDSHRSDLVGKLSSSESSSFGGKSGEFKTVTRTPGSSSYVERVEISRQPVVSEKKFYIINGEEIQPSELSKKIVSSQVIEQQSRGSDEASKHFLASEGNTETVKTIKTISGDSQQGFSVGGHAVSGSTEQLIPGGYKTITTTITKKIIPGETILVPGSVTTTTYKKSGSPVTILGEESSSLTNLRGNEEGSLISTAKFGPKIVEGSDLLGGSSFTTKTIKTEKITSESIPTESLTSSLVSKSSGISTPLSIPLEKASLDDSSVKTTIHTERVSETKPSVPEGFAAEGALSSSSGMVSSVTSETLVKKVEV